MQQRDSGDVPEAALPAPHPVIGVHREVDDALAAAMTPAQPDDAEPAAASDAEPGIAGRCLEVARTTASKAADSVLAGGRATAAGVTAAGAAAGAALGSVGSATAQAVSTGTQRATDATTKWAASVLSAAQGLLASDLSDAFNDLTQAAVKGQATIYDKAMDAEYLATHVGGGNHRLFDGGHTINGAWQAARNASEDDTLVAEMLGTLQGLLRDVSTPKGLPLATWDKETFDSVAESLQTNFGIQKSWFADLVSYDAAELLGGTVGVVSMIFNWNKADTADFAQLAASMGLSAALSANPLLMPISVVALARAFHKAKSDGNYADVADGALRGTLASGASMGAVALVGVAGGPAGAALLAGISAAALAHAAAKHVEFAAVSKFVKEDVAAVARQVSERTIDLGDAIGSFAASSGRAVADGTANAGKFVAGSASDIGQLTAEQAAAAGRAAASGTKAVGRLAARGTAATGASIGSAAKRVKGLVDRDEAAEAEHEDESVPPTD